MHPEEIKAKVRMRGTTPTALAQELGVSRSMVAHVIHGRFVSARIRRRIAEVIGLPVNVIWAPKAPSLLRRSKSSLARRAA